LFMTTYQWISVFLIVAITLAAAVIDMRSRRIPNWFTVPVCVAGLLFHTVTGGLPGLGMSLGGLATGFGILLVLWLIGGGGGGDVKLMGALGAWLGAMSTVFVVVLSAGMAALFSIAVVIVGVARHGYTYVQKRHFRRAEELVSKKKTKRSEEEEMAKRRGRRRLLPYALPVALSTWLVLVWYVISQGQ
jgi:prepilin peptidase CpaA